MAEDSVLERIDAWQAAGLLDENTAGRLRAAEAAAGTGSGGSGASGAGSPRPRSAIAAVFGPGVTVGEVFGYLGSAFLFAAWMAVITTGGEPSGLGLLVAGGVLAALAFGMRGRSIRFARAAGVALVASGASLGGGVYQLLDEPRLLSNLPELAAAATWLISAVAFRWLHRALATQVGLIAAILTATGVLMDVLEDVIFGQPTFDNAVADSPVRVVLLAIGWGIAAIVLGVVGLLESRRVDPGAAARSGITRLAAGLTAVLGTATAVFASGSLGNGEYGRLIEPVIGDAALIVVSAVLLERAFRRQASAFVYPAALGVIIGLSDLNASYFATATSPQLALLVEGVILLAAGLAFDRLRRRVGTLADEDEGVAAVPVESGAA